MQFRTEVNIPEQDIKIQPNSVLFSIGSCFADELAQIFKKSQLQMLSNPFGTVFNPFTISQILDRICNKKIYTEEDLVEYKGKIISMDHHTAFDGNLAQDVLKKINDKLHEAHNFLRKTNFVFITLGTSYVYNFLPKNKIIGNCHKIPSKFFHKKLLTNNEIQHSLINIINILKDFCQPNVQICFTISPVRHTKDGIVENQRSKARLISSLHDTLDENNTLKYIPIYEMLIDDLRDYRFYKPDMIHPTEQAFQYVFEKFSQSFCTQETIDFIQENLKIQQGINHKPSDEKSMEYIDFQRKLKEKIKKQQSKVQHTIFSEELQKLPYLL